MWSGWRAAYLGEVEASGRASALSPFTQMLESDMPDTETNIVYRGDTVFAIMNRFPYTTGHVLVLPYREVPDLTDLTAEESIEMWATVTDALAAVRAAFRPDGVNVGMNLGSASGGSVPTHVHAHVVPRWAGDTSFMSSIANVQTLPEALDVSADRLRTAWPK